MEKVKLNFKVKKFTNLSDAQWAIIQKFVDTGRKIKKDLREIISDDILEKFEVISTHRDRVSGHFALFKNNAWNLNMPFKIKGWQSKLENHKRISVDERYLASVYSPFLERLILLKKLLKRIVGIEQVLAST